MRLLMIDLDGTCVFIEQLAAVSVVIAAVLVLLIWIGGHRWVEHLDLLYVFLLRWGFSCCDIVVSHEHHVRCCSLLTWMLLGRKSVHIVLHELRALAVWASTIALHVWMIVASMGWVWLWLLLIDCRCITWHHQHLLAHLLALCVLVKTITYILVVHSLFLAIG